MSFQMVSLLLRYFDHPKFTLLKELMVSFKITLHGDLSFYKTPNAKFMLNDQTKTGLGSSSALTASLCTAIIAILNKVLFKRNGDNNLIKESTIVKENGLLSDEKLKIISHMAALLAHNKAQGKVGSGFDIAAAFYGDVLFKRRAEDFNIKNFERRMNELSVVERIKCFEEFEMSGGEFVLPAGIAVLVGGVGKGSNTPFMVRKVLNWCREFRERSEMLWEEMDRINKNIKENLILLKKIHENSNLNGHNLIKNFTEKTLSIFDLMKKSHNNKTIDYMNSLGVKFESNFSKDYLKCTLKISILFKQSSALYKVIGNYAGVDIEPESQRNIINMTDKVSGVIASFIPGAGGSDAIACITFDTPLAKKNVKKLWKSKNVYMLNVKVGNRHENAHKGIKIDFN